MKKANSLISVEDLSTANIEKIVSLAFSLKKNPQKYKDALEGKKIALIFEKPSTRTWVSFETGVFSLGGDTIFLGPKDIQLGVREEIKDVARVLERYLAGIVLRTFEHRTVVTFNEYFKGPVINGLSNKEHPCQALADYMTIREYAKTKKPIISYVGDANNVFTSLLLVAAKTGSQLQYATPKGFEPSPTFMTKVRKIGKESGAKFTGFYDPKHAVQNADFVYTDVWVSMGEEKIRAEKLNAFQGMQVNAALLKHANKDAKVMHCLPAHRGEEITNNVIEGSQSIVFDQAENRLHIQKAILLYLFDQCK